ncbi:hypothetical protein HN695_02485 [Candidatus Woesearchaeota archaeon]|nr:hypothetical protein [Candidatus Woesearchaeota archaeon]MBT5272953.1 hypothetical protein [Candidatus Woesearchaeota archaeon]MBT6041419.1 hypothetical protein [Candidatus Woesearchaeota archaeon]MBT6337302.1 hypothetical protein [Candidatus Woesearchaeota archaeon]MBT7927179.1 hypothetical protein [Candidatus Woesearchaeota archaeon]
MKENFILKTAFIISVLGIVLLYLFVDQLILPETRLNETIEDESLIKIIGNINKITIKNSTTENKTFSIIQVEQRNIISVYVDKELNVTEGSNIEIIGKKQGDLVFAEEISG